MPPSDGVMNPHPLATLNHLHLPRLLTPITLPGLPVVGAGVAAGEEEREEEEGEQALLLA